MLDIAKELLELRAIFDSGVLLDDKRKQHKGSSLICMKKKRVQTRTKPFMAYDLETTRIKAGTPKLLYLTVHGDNYNLSMPIKGRDRYQAFCDILETHILIPEFSRYRFIAWNGNNFDVFFLAKALLKSDRWILKPYLTRTKSLRGLKVMENKKTKKGETKLSFEFLDGLAMTGLGSSNLRSLKKFLEVFAPEYQKLDVVNFAKEDFDPKNTEHVKYAERDSEGLYYGIKRANEIVKELTGNELQPTIGNLAIKYFQASMPDNKEVWKPPQSLLDVLYAQLKRGGYCWIQKQYHGPVWKYDLNQAYAAAMRDTDLPAGQCMRTDEYKKGVSAVYQVKMRRDIESQIPFYYRTLDKNLGYFTCGAEVETWITNIEYEHLIKDRWYIEVLDGYVWDDGFNMSEMVTNLERLRFTDPKGPSGPLGITVKMIGNNAYGKTLEQLEGMELVFANDCPKEFIPYMPENPEMDYVFCRLREPLKRAYHQPQVGVFVTAHVRMLVREAALKSADKFLYADTDCVVFSEPVDYLDIDEKRYGAWKREVDGLDYIIIGKKIYCDKKGLKKAKGLNIKELTLDDYELWLNGKPPKQIQTQRQNFVKFMSGKNMFLNSERRGTDVTISQHARLVGDRFVPISQ